MAAMSMMNRIRQTYRRVRRELSENVFLLLILWVVTRPLEDRITKNISMLFDEFGIPAARTFFEPYGLIGTIVIIITLIVFIHAYIDTVRHEDDKEDDPIKSIEKRVSFIEDNAATKCELGYEQENRVAAIDGLGMRISNLEAPVSAEPTKEHKTAPMPSQRLPLCPLEIVFDPSNQIYRKFIEEQSPLGSMFGKQKRKVWYFELWNEPPSRDIANVSVCVETIETILSKPTTGSFGPAHLSYGEKLKYEGGATERLFPPGHREKVALCSSLFGSDRIRIEGTDTVFQYCGGHHKLKVVITCSGHSQEDGTFKVWIDDAGALQVELERESPTIAALKKLSKSHTSGF